MKPKMLNENREEMICVPLYPLGISGEDVKTLPETVLKRQNSGFSGWEKGLDCLGQRCALNVEQNK